MNILGFILGKKDSLEAVPASSFDFSNFLSFLEQEGAFVICGTGREMNRFYHKVSFTERPRPFLIKKFALLTGDIDNIITAIPLDSRKVLDPALTALCLAKRPSFKKRFMISVFRVLNLPFLYRFVFRRQFCLVITNKKETFFSFLSQGLNVPDIKLSFSIYKSSGKFVAPLFNSETGENIGYAKIYASKKDSEHYGKIEARALKFLEQFSFKSAETPRLLLSNYFADKLVLVVSSKAGLRNFKGISNEHVEWIKELARKTGVKKDFKDSSFAGVIKKEIELIKNNLNGSDFELVNYFYEKAVKALSEKEFIFSFVNREFDYHELLRHKDKNLVIDWEHAREDFPPLFDVYSLLLSGGSHKGNDYVEIHLQNIEFVFFHGNKKNNEVIGGLLREWGISKREAYLFFLLFFIDKLYIFLHTGSYQDGKIVTRFLRRVYNNESRYQEYWLSDIQHKQKNSNSLKPYD